MILPSQLTTTTRFSKILTGILFILLPVVGFYLGMYYISHSPKHPSETTSLTTSLTIPVVNEIIFNGTRLKEGDVFNFSPNGNCILDTQVKLLTVKDKSIVVQKLQKQGMNLKYYPVDDNATLEIENNTCIEAPSSCLDVGYKYCFTTQKSQGTTEYLMTTPSESLFPFTQ